MISDLVYDVGMGSGDDSAYYLWRGYRVVAVEANPDLVEAAKARFAGEIRAGRLTVLGVGIGPRRERATFWVNDLKKDWSSFIRELGCRDGTACHPIEIPCYPFGEILRSHGVPYYLKIDIEQHDRYCLEALAPPDLPAYISVEAHSVEYLDMLAGLGYDAFKLVSQKRHGGPLGVAFRALRRLARSRVGRLLRIPAPLRILGFWGFPHGSSGPFGEDTPGPWLGREEVAVQWEGVIREDVWFDFHAKRR